MSLFTWACRQEGNDFMIQFLYINKEPVTSTIGSFGRPTDSASYQLDLRSVEIKFTQQSTKDVYQWLIQNNPDLWNSAKLNRLIPE